ncbi:MAG: P27 family phage terminase small subunit [Staphylococcus epidermidis]|nr:P27 family phage terminase small subunit [Staphylococcus epidermidis]
MYREAYDNVQTKAYKSLQDNLGQIVGKDFVGYKKNSAVGTMKDAINLMSTIGAELGLSPKSRVELFKTIKSNNKKSSAESMKDFFGK